MVLYKSMKKATIYTTSSCVYCKMAKEFFAKNGVAYDEYDVGENAEKRKEMFDISGQMGVPVILIEGESEHILGFNKPKLMQALGIDA